MKMPCLGGGRIVVAKQPSDREEARRFHYISQNCRWTPRLIVRLSRIGVFVRGASR
jgi:hypothetical protein